MKFATVAFATTAAASVAVRDAATVQSVLSTISTQITNVDNAAKAYNGGEPTEALNAAKGLISALTSGKTKVDGSGSLTLIDATTLAPPVQALTKKGQALEADLVKKRDLVEKAGQCAQVRSAVGQVVDNGNALVSAVIGKVSGDNVKDIASSLAAPLVSVLAKAQDDYSESNCQDSGNSGGSKPATSAATTTASSGETSSESAPTSTSEGGSVPTTPVVVPTTTTGSVTTPTVQPAGASLLAPAGVLALALAVFAL